MRYIDGPDDPAKRAWPKAKVQIVRCKLHTGSPHMIVTFCSCHCVKPRTRVTQPPRSNYLAPAQLPAPQPTQSCQIRHMAAKMPFRSVPSRNWARRSGLASARVTVVNTRMALPTVESMALTRLHPPRDFALKLRKTAYHTKETVFMGSNETAMHEGRQQRSLWVRLRMPSEGLARMTQYQARCQGKLVLRRLAAHFGHECDARDDCGSELTRTQAKRKARSASRCSHNQRDARAKGSVELAHLQ